jgi:hypothetical protein
VFPTGVGMNHSGVLHTSSLSFLPTILDKIKIHPFDAYFLNLTVIVPWKKVKVSNSNE